MLRRDDWLSDVLELEVYATDATGAAPDDGRRSLTFAKVDVADTPAGVRLQDAGFRIVDTNVTFEHKGGTPAAPAVSVAPAAGGHAEALINLAGRAFRYSRFHLDPALPDDLANRVKREWVRNYTTGRRGLELLAAVDGATPVGFLAVLEQGDARVIDLVAVAPEAQGRGVGRTLVDTFVRRHAGNGRRLVVGTQLANAPSLRLYAACGFEVASASYVFHLHRGL